MNASLLLIDDFSIDQEEVRTNQLAAWDTVYDESILSGHRWLLAGGESIPGNCSSSTMAVGVANGVMTITNGPDCQGTGMVGWGADATGLDFDTSPVFGLQIRVADVVGGASTQINLYSSNGTVHRLMADLSHAGTYDFLFSEFEDSESINPIRRIIVATGFIGDYIALDSFSFIVPEPLSLAILLPAAVSLLIFRERHASLR